MAIFNKANSNARKQIMTFSDFHRLNWFTVVRNGKCVILDGKDIIEEEDGRYSYKILASEDDWIKVAHKLNIDIRIID